MLNEDDHVALKEVDVVIIGAGAAGLMCAAEAGKRGRKVLVLEHGKKPGRKILISGGGKCNFTNLEVSAKNYLCNNPHFVKSALAQYSQWDFISLISQHGIDWEERDHGQLFCLDSAKNIVDMLLKECYLPNIELQYFADTQEIKKSECGFELSVHSQKNKQNQTIKCQSLVIATGGLSMPKLGASPFGYQVAEQFALKRVPTQAGLVPFTLHDKDKLTLAPLSGIAIPVTIRLTSGISFSENLLFTHRGLSGPAVLQISSYWKAGEPIFISLLSDIEWDTQSNQCLKNYLAKYLPKRLVEALIERGELKDKPIKQFTHKELFDIEHLLQNWKISPNGTEGYRTAEVTLGGVDTDELSSKTMEAKKVQGLYFIGEVMDVAGWLGGLNFQWTWSSGWVAGQHV